MKRFSVAVMLVVGLLGFHLTPVQTASAALWYPTAGAHFNVPRADGKFRIERQILAAINHARPGSVIKISVFSFDRMVVADALIAARQRGVNVQLLMNNHQMNRVMRRLHNALGTDRTKESFAYECTYGCRSYGENLHTKMYLFSHTGGARNVVMTGSVNLTYNAVNNQYNDLLVRNDASQLYRAFSDLFEKLRVDKPTGSPYYKQIINAAYQLEVLPYPNFGPTNDPVISALNRVRCFGASGGTGANGRTVIRVSMHAWNDYRGAYLANKIRNLFAAGCDVRVMYGMAGASVRNALAQRTKRGYVPVHINGYDTEAQGYDGEIDLYSHQKIMLISGNWGGDSSSSLTYTGSSNWNAGGAKGDEIIFRASGSGTVRAYRTNFNWIWANRSHLARYIPYRTASTSSYRTTFFRTTEETVPSPGGPAWEND